MIKKRSFDFFFSWKKLLVSGLILCSLGIHFAFIFYTKDRNPHKKPLQILSQTTEPFIENGMDIQVLKFKWKGNIYLEFSSRQPDGTYSIINSVQLKGNREAYFEYWGEEKKITSLLVLDDDGDGNMDVMAPTFDQFFRPQINLVSFNKKTKQFELRDDSKHPQIITPHSRNYWKEQTENL